MTRFTGKTIDKEGGLVKTFISYVLPIALLFLFCCVEIIVCWNFALNHTLAFEFVDLSGENGVFFFVLAMFLSLPLFILHFATTRLFWGWRFFLFAVINGPMSFNYYFWVALIASV